MKILKTFLFVLVIILLVGFGYLVYSNKLISLIASKIEGEEIQTEQEAAQEPQAEGPSDEMVEEAMNRVMEYLAAQKLTEAGVPQETAEKLIGSVSDEDKAAIMKIVQERVDPETMQEISDMAAGDSTPDEAAKKMDELLTPELYDQMGQVIQKYAVELLLP